MNDTRIAAINAQYQQRETNLAAARGLDAPDFDAVETENEVPDEGLPTKAWKKDKIVDWLLANGIEAERSDLEDLTKAELVENFVDDEG